MPDVGERVRSKFNNLAGIILAVALAAFVLDFLFGWHTSAVVAMILASLLFPTLLLLGYFSGRYQGFASTDRPIRLIEKLISFKVEPSSVEGVTFQDIKDGTGKSLKIVAANMETGQLKLFSPETTPNVQVARAVMASAAIPLVFRPVLIKVGNEEAQYCDGGIVSNLPAWTFDRERLTDENCLVITCELAPSKKDPPKRRSLRGARLLTRVGVTALFGGSGLNTRGMLHHLRLENWAGFSLLDFDAVMEQIELIESSEKYAEVEIDLENHHRRSIDALHAKLEQFCKDKGNHSSNLRVAYARHVNLVDTPPAAFHLWNCRGFGEYMDENLILPAGNSLLGCALELGEPKLFDLTDHTVRTQFYGNGDPAFPEKGLPKDRSWVVIVPITSKKLHKRVSVAVCIDGDKPFSGDPDKISSEIGEIVTTYV